MQARSRFGHIKQIIVTAHDIMIVGKMPNHSKYDQALTTLLETARRSNVRLNYDKLQCKKQEVDFSIKHTPQAVANLIRTMTQQSPVDQSAFTQVKNEISSAPILAYYNPKKQTVLHTDASIKGLGAGFLQEEKPVYFGCKALTDAQQGFVAIELESLAVAWAMEKFHHFLYASHFILETN